MRENLIYVEATFNKMLTKTVGEGCTTSKEFQGTLLEFSKFILDQIQKYQKPLVIVNTLVFGATVYDLLRDENKKDLYQSFILMKAVV